MYFDQTPDISICSGWCYGGPDQNYSSMVRLDFTDDNNRDDWTGDNAISQTVLGATGIVVRGSPREPKGDIFQI